MRTFFKLSFIACLLFFTAQSGYAQFHMSVGPQTAFNYNLHIGSDLKETGNGMGFAFGGTVDMMFTNMIGLTFNMQFYDLRSGTTDESFTGTAYANNQPIQARFDIETEGTFAYFQIEPLFKLRLPGSGFYFVGGFALGFNETGEYSQTTTITALDNPQLTGEEKSEGDFKDTPMRFATVLGAGMDLPVSSLVTLAPQFTWRYGLTKAVKDVKWQIMTFQALFAVKFNVL